MSNNLDKLEILATTKADSGRQKTVNMRRKIIENLDKIEAARANGWTLDQIADAIGIVAKNPRSTLSAYLISIKRSQQASQTKPQNPLPPPAPARKPGTLDLSKYDPNNLPPPPSFAIKPETDFDRLKRETDARLQAQIAAIQAKSNQPKDVK